MVLKLLRHAQGFAEIMMAGYTAHCDRLHSVGARYPRHATVLEPGSKDIMDHNRERPARLMSNVLKLPGNFIVDCQRGPHEFRSNQRRSYELVTAEFRLPWPHQERTRIRLVKRHDI